MNIPPKNDVDLLYLRMDELNKKLDLTNALVDALIRELRELREKK